MATTPWKPRRETLAAALVFVLVAAGGARLIALGASRHAVAAREAATLAANDQARSIERQLAALLESARRELRRARPAANLQSAGIAPDFAPAARGDIRLRLDPGGRIIAGSADPAADTAIAAAVAAADGRAVGASGVLSPLRYGGRWLVAAWAAPAAAGSEGPPGAVIVCRDLVRILVDAGVGALVRSGYDVQVADHDPAAGRWRGFIPPRIGALEDAVSVVLRPPVAQPAGGRPAELTLMLRPKSGWIRPSRVAADVAILAALAWLLALASHDAVRTTGRLRVALATAHQRLQLARQRLTSEIAAREELQKSVEHAQYHDAFTGLPNRRYLMNQLDRGLRLARTRRRYSVAVMLIAVDRFRLVTDTLGQNAGDELMIQVARRLEATAPAAERIIARWAPDQFAVLLLDVHSIETALSAARLMQQALGGAFAIRRFRLSVAACVGVTCVPAGLHRAEDVLREADIALSAAVEKGGSQVVPFAAAMRRRAAALVHLEADLHVALERGEFRTLLQPIVELRSRRCVGVEALLRWKHPTRGMLVPAQFLAIAEDAGLTLRITRWMILRVCTLAAEWRPRLPPGAAFFVSANVSATALRDPAFAAFVASALRNTELPAEFLRLELREDALASGWGAARDALDGLRRCGVQLMLDDFGTGYSSLAYLQHGGFDYVKIDRSRVCNADAASIENGIVASMVQLARTLGLRTIAENVESESAAQRLEQIGCEFGQGYHFSRPASPERAMPLILDNVQLRRSAGGGAAGGQAETA